MNELSAIVAALRAANLPPNVKSMTDLSGGCIHRVLEVRLDDGQRLVAKVNRATLLNLFEEEAHGLAALEATGTVVVPRPLSVVAHEDLAVLVMTAIDSGAGNQRGAWAEFGRDLAALHAAELPSRLAGQGYGFDIDNHLGSTFQPNRWHDDWVEFNAVNRLGFQLETAAGGDLLDAAEVELITRVIDELEQLIPRDPQPSLLHGDLWSGNALPAMRGDQATMAVIDPACSVGDGWADIAMMKLFGGFDRACFDEYESIRGRPDDLESRLMVYQLYHVLNHLNIFGRGYASQAVAIARQVLDRSASS